MRGCTREQQIAQELGVSGLGRARQAEGSRHREQMRRADPRRIKVVSSANSNARRNPYDEGILERCVENLKLG